MTWRGLAKGLLFGAGMLCGATAGNLFYFERYWPGVAMFALTALCLFYAMSDLVYSEDTEEEHLEAVAALRKALAEVALIAADNALNGAKHIGRSLPYTPAELDKLEDDQMPLLSS
jgi:hypothetical protein